MGAMDEVFGKRSGRPDHPDFWRMSEVFLASDGAIQAATDEEEKEKVWRGIVDPVVDRASLLYMAHERVTFAFGGRQLSPERAKILALVVDAFVAGALYQQRGGHQES